MWNFKKNNVKKSNSIDWLILLITVFVCWAIVMTYEIVGSRVLWPYFWSSTFVWTSLIWIILWSLSLWYYLWWKLSDKRASFNFLWCIVLSAGLLILIMCLLKDDLLVIFYENIKDLKTAIIVSSVVIFWPASILLWMVSPYAVKLKLENLNTSGSTVWSLYAISTLWSIVWTFSAWFYLIPFFWTNKLLILLSIVLFIVSLLLIRNMLIFLIAIIIASLSAYLIYTNSPILKLNTSKNWFFIDTDSSYSRIYIYDWYSKNSENNIRYFKLDSSNSSAMFLNKDWLVYEYTKHYDLAKVFNPNFKKTLMLWWAGYSYPKHFLKTYPEATIDVVEIDPKVTELSKKYFNLKENSRLNIFHEDWRVFLNNSKDKYDVIFWDAFSSLYSMPFHLTTIETARKKYDLLNDWWVVILNIISSIEWESWKILRAEYKTYKQVFDNVLIIPVHTTEKSDVTQNIMLVAIKWDWPENIDSKDEQLSKFLENIRTKEINTDDVPILTDNYAPVDYYAWLAIYNN